MRAAVALSLILVTTPALAEPAYVGRWSMLPGCKRPVVITATSVEADESLCTFAPTQPRQGTWTLKLQCAEEGIESTQTVRWRVDGGRLITIAGKTTETYKRCSGAR